MMAGGCGNNEGCAGTYATGGGCFGGCMNTGFAGGGGCLGFDGCGCSHTSGWGGGCAGCGGCSLPAVIGGRRGSSSVDFFAAFDMVSGVELGPITKTRNTLANDDTLDLLLDDDALEQMDNELFEPLSNFDDDVKLVMMEVITEKVRRILSLNPAKYGENGKLPFGLLPYKKEENNHMFSADLMERLQLLELRITEFGEENTQLQAQHAASREAIATWKQKCAKLQADFDELRKEKNKLPEPEVEVKPKRTLELPPAEAAAPVPANATGFTEQEVKQRIAEAVQPWKDNLAELEKALRMAENQLKYLNDQLLDAKAEAHKAQAELAYLQTQLNGKLASRRETRKEQQDIAAPLPTSDMDLASAPARPPTAPAPAQAQAQASALASAPHEDDDSDSNLHLRVQLRRQKRVLKATLGRFHDVMSKVGQVAMAFDPEAAKEIQEWKAQLEKVMGHRTGGDGSKAVDSVLGSRLSTPGSMTLSGMFSRGSDRGHLTGTPCTAPFSRGQERYGLLGTFPDHEISTPRREKLSSAVSKTIGPDPNDSKGSHGDASDEGRDMFDGDSINRSTPMRMDSAGGKLGFRTTATSISSGGAASWFKASGPPAGTSVATSMTPERGMSRGPSQVELYTELDLEDDDLTHDAAVVDALPVFEDWMLTTMDTLDKIKQEKEAQDLALRADRLGRRHLIEDVKASDLSAAELARRQRELEEQRKKCREQQDEISRLLITIDELRKRLGHMKQLLDASGTNISSILTTSGLRDVMEVNSGPRLKCVFDRLYLDAVERIERHSLIRDQVSLANRAYSTVVDAVTTEDGGQRADAVPDFEHLSATAAANVRGMWYHTEYLFRRTCEYAMTQGLEASILQAGSSISELQKALGELDARRGNEEELKPRQPERLPCRRSERKLVPFASMHGNTAAMHSPSKAPKVVEIESMPFTAYVAAIRDAQEAGHTEWRSGASPELKRMKTENLQQDTRTLKAAVAEPKRLGDRASSLSRSMPTLPSLPKGRRFFQTNTEGHS